MNATLIYDANCPLCCVARDWVEHHAIPGAFDFVACQSDERARRFPEAGEEQCMQAMQLIYADGRRYSGDAALPHICLGLKRWRWIATILSVPPISTLSPYVYGYVARNRRMFSILVARKAPESCPTSSPE